MTGFVGETAKGGDRRQRRPHRHDPQPRAEGQGAEGQDASRCGRPFKLTASGQRPDGDKLTYLWEQNDQGGAKGTKLVANKKTYGPLFRVFGTRAKVTNRGTLQSPSPNLNIADGNPTRYFPDLAQVLKGNTNARTGCCPLVPLLPDDLDDYEPVKGKVVDCYSEFLPVKGYLGRPNAKSPSMHFRVTVRDGFPNGGGVDFADVTLKIDPRTGPFLVTSQSKKGTVVRAGSKRLVTWKVNGTRSLAENVRIRLSPTVGKTWRTLAVRRPTTAAPRCASPTSGRGKARIMVEARRQLLLRRQRQAVQDRLRRGDVPVGHRAAPRARPVPGEQATADQLGRRARERLRAVVGGEHVRLVGEQHDVRARAVEVLQGDLRVAVGGVGVHVVPAQPADEVAGERVPADDHPRVAPDRDGDRAR